MNARQLTSLWEHYAVSNNIHLQGAESIATLFGMDEVEIDFSGGRIVLPDAGAVEVEGSPARKARLTGSRWSTRTTPCGLCLVPDRRLIPGTPCPL
ncbi:hypothetical protein AWV80_41745 [Cupriavidus sp. UYMU48A]|nr:hypothetical protein AWV80_41745 [Cupriavidus sp. UYMU48A]